METRQSVRWVFAAVFFLAGAGTTHGFTVDTESALRTQLLVNYSSSVRPSSITLIQLSINLLSINFVDMKNELFSVSGWWSIKWTDSRLAWTGTAYTVPVIQVYEADIWTPALVVSNSVNDLTAINEQTIPIRIRMDGEVTWNPPGILVTSCAIDVINFPFDTQTCTLEVTSFGFTIQELNISVHSTGVNTKYFSENGEWTLLGTWNERSEFDEDGYSYAKVIYNFRLERRAVYYGLNTMLPVLLNSLLIPLVFLLPHDSGEKIGYCLTVLLAYVVILTIVTAGLPTTAKVQSLLGVYIAIVLMLSGLSVALAIHSLHLYHRPASRPVPHWQVRFTRFVLLLMGKDCTCSQGRERVKPAPLRAPSRHRQLSFEDRKSGLHHPNDTAANFQPGVEADVTGLTSQRHGEDGEMTWQDVARAYDSFFLRLYFLIILCSSVSFLFSVTADRI